MTDINGILPVYKPRGMVSKDVSRALTRTLGRIRMGHAGTLDPMAEGVLPIMLGNATRYQDFVVAMPKAYEFDVALGYETTTLDAEGEVVLRSPVPPLMRQPTDIIAGLSGTRMQIPPVHSAVKIDGKPLYEYARSGRALPVPVENLARQITIHELTLITQAVDLLTYRVRCSKGTYVRVLAKEIAQSLGTCGTVTRLVRTMSGGIGQENAVPFEVCNKSADEIRPLLISPESLNLPVPRAQCESEEISRKLRNGLPVALDRVRFFPDKALFSGVETARAPDFFGAPEALASDVLLFSGTIAFGIGSVFQDDSGRSLVRMRRGL